MKKILPFQTTISFSIFFVFCTFSFYYQEVNANLLYNEANKSILNGSVSLIEKFVVIDTPQLQEIIQGKKRPPQKLDQTIAAMISSSSPEVAANGYHLQKLAYNLNPTLYIRNGSINNPSGKAPVCLDTDIASLGKLYEANELYQQVEYITIRVEKANDLSAMVNSAKFQEFINLKYIYFLCTFEICIGDGCEIPIISQMVQETESLNLLILYKVSIPE